jgi:hypothetical protein
LWVSPADPPARMIADGAAIRKANQRRAINPRAPVTSRIPPGNLWMHDGWAGLNRLSSGAAVLPDAAVDLFGFSGGQAAFDARVEIAGIDRESSVGMDKDDLTDDLVQTPPSSLDLDRSASSARSGRARLRDTFEQHTDTNPIVAGGDVDADWESAATVGDEAPGGDNPTPDQDIVDEIGRAVGLEYQDTEELGGEEKLQSRDRRRWELDPASSEDYRERE